MAGLVTVKEIFEHFMEWYVCGKVDKCQDYLTEDTTIEYSTVGTHKGISEIVNALHINNDFNIHYSTVSDLMEFENGDDSIIMAKGHHYTAYRDGEFLFPFLWGGKYEFAVNRNTGTISYIRFFLEYEFGNTYMAKMDWGWKMYEETKDLKTSIVGGYQAYKAVVPEKEKDRIQDALYKLLWDFDNMEYEECLKRVSEDVYVRVKLFEEVGPSKEYFRKDEFKKMMDDNLAYEDQTQMSIHFEDIEIKDDTAIVRVKRYNPGKVVNKHVDVSTIHKLFFNMRFVIRMIKAEGEWIVKEINVTPINDVDALGFNYMEVKETQLNTVQSAFYR